MAAAQIILRMPNKHIRWTEQSPEQPPCKPGQRLRRIVYPNARRKNRFHAATVKSVWRYNSYGRTGWKLILLRDGAKQQSVFYLGESTDLSPWELMPEVDLLSDGTAVSLARAVLAGDEIAARALADRVIELCQGMNK